MLCPPPYERTEILKFSVVAALYSLTTRKDGNTRLVVWLQTAQKDGNTRLVVWLLCPSPHERTGTVALWCGCSVHHHTKRREYVKFSGVTALYITTRKGRNTSGVAADLYSLRERTGILV